ncbi:hypothetical protein AQJ23_16570 [Streptomyces antibioticus]|nr:hypothetical protein [Streptomyces antibioticus]KUN25489.1 hypothetical protein AQJ23_16570 [Streptomyces antibioticus]
MKIRRRLGALSVVLAMAGVSLIAASAGLSAQSGPLSSAASDGSSTVTNSSSPSFAGWAAGHPNIAAGLHKMSYQPFHRPLDLLGLA